MLELKGPSVSEMKNFIKEKSTIEFFTIINKNIKGQIMWADEQAIQIKQDNGSLVTLLKSAIVFYSKLK